MSDVVPSRAAAVELKDERRAMHEGWVFLDEKCLLLAGEILAQLARHDALQRDFLALHAKAVLALRAAVSRHGLRGLQVHPAADLGAARVTAHQRSLMGVRLQDAVFEPNEKPPLPAVDESPEADDCRLAHAALLQAAPALAAVAGNLERLSAEYRRSLRRARALQDVMLPELDRTLGEIENRLDEGEREDAVSMRRFALKA